jgi:bifunctional non-homologous end joining protein LigD
VAVEDHPLDYASFEGRIPEGNYGAGGVIVWDQGVWIPLEDPAEGLRKGKLLFELRGYKLRGVWTLVRTKGSGGKDWLLIKKPDAFADPAANLSEQSIQSGLTVEEIQAGVSRQAEIVAELERLRAPRRRLSARDVGLMLAGIRDQPFSGKDWLFELKYDGYRLLVGKGASGTELLYRRGSEVSASFPEITRAVAALPLGSLVMDGEVVVADDENRPSFARLQKRVQLTRPLDIERATLDLPATVYLFDLLACEGFDLRGLPLTLRKRLLARLLPAAGPLRFADHVAERGEDLFREIRRLGLEGMIAKKAASPYRAGRSDDWLKVRIERTGDFVVVGFTERKSGDGGIGALHLGVFEDGTLCYAGKVGTGFTAKQAVDLRSRLIERRRAKPAFIGDPPAGPGSVWVDPELVCEVRYRDWTEDGALRHSVFLRLRDDKPASECTREGALPPPPSEAAEPPERTVPFSHLDKVFWPKEGYTKGDLIDFYREVSPWLLPYLRDRPLVLTRFPDGIEGKSFYQKDAPGFVPDWIRTERIWSGHAERDIDYFVCDDQASLLYLVNLGTIPLHIWSSRVGSLQTPDWCILDLDPKGAPFTDVVEVAIAIRALCEVIELPSFVKTSGASGLHVLLPLAAELTYEQSRLLGELLSRVIVTELPAIATIIRKIDARAGRVYLDYLQNRHGQTIASPFSVRPLPGAPVSTPLRWSEVGPRLDPGSFTIKTLQRRLDRLGGDPLLPVLSSKPDLAKVLTRLQERAARSAVSTSNRQRGMRRRSPSPRSGGKQQ